ncbi:MAG: DUF2127 domain-containing protein [Candidatus Magasanikbacteria bacterium]|nr:DUF2127 domain-containing protein [Candidatus Magasanikbacteria bacterium]
MRERNWHELFEIGILIKTINGVLELIAGLGLLFLNGAFFNQAILTLFRQELLEDPQDFLVNKIASFFATLSVSTQNFAAIYLLFHAAIKFFIAFSLYKEKLWAYSVSLWIMASFFIYQIYHLSHKFSVFLLVLMIIDFLFFLIIRHEYKYKRAHPHTKF